MDAKSLNILITDDEIDACKALEIYMRKQGHAALSVYNGSDAISHVKNNHTDIVLLDIKMPGKDGIETLKEIRSFNKDVIIIMVTAVDNIEIAIGTIKDGSDDFIRKPVVFTELEKSISQAVEKRKMLYDLHGFDENIEKIVGEQTSELKQMYLLLKNAYLEIVRALSEAIEAKDPYTEGHCKRVTALSLQLGNETGLTSEQLETLELGSLLHDIGKIGIRGAVLNKPGKLTTEEYNHVKEHPVIGDKIVSKSVYLEKSRQMIRGHHEWLDGSGYPDQKEKNNIDILTKIVMIADVYDAMTSDRPYRKPMPHKQVIAIMQSEKGSHFDQKLLEIFINKILSGKNKV
ncbi:hypothetical protein MNBD_NITROSPINAE02-424 [hydrothermal vent metagenome]|uniref:Response regulator n=1 Tax=hydrothermal vent metagenome TaxID=652676 RepID=A0A3B1DB33_9ZZZZ